MRQTIEASEYFDADWYADRYPDVRLLGLSPAEHYLRIGASLLRDPGPGFSTAYYLAENPDVAQAGANALLHYITHGRDEGRQIKPSGHHMLPPPPEFPVPLLSADPPAEKPARLICFYLPQFHPIPENDAWWGKGFTEWTNVRPAQPQLARHYQPHVPGELGYYDLGDTAVQRRQIELAKLYGIEGFCFYFYWFAGKRLLETPVRNYLDDPSLDLPFCLCWANENWSRRWDGRDDDVLIAQDHSPQDDLAFIKHVAQYMRDPRYIRVDGKPLLLLYRPSLLPDPLATSTRWREWCRQNGLGEIYLAYTQSFESNNPEEYGLDAAIEFPPNNTQPPSLTEHCQTYAGFQGRIYDWSALVERSFSYRSKPYTLYRGLCPSWDNTARRGVNGTILANSTPARFTRWATNAIQDAKSRFKKPDQRLVFVNAWNEWAEGAHLEPDQRYGYAWLESIRMALACNTSIDRVATDDTTAIAIAIDARRSADLDVILEQCKAIPRKHQLFVTTTQSRANLVRDLLKAPGEEHALHIVPDDDPDPVPLLKLLLSIQAQGYGLVIHLTTRIASSDADSTLAEVLQENYIEDAVTRFAADSTLGMICPDSQRLAVPDAVAHTLRQIGNRLGLDNKEINGQETWQGCAFIARTIALAPLANLAFSAENFEPGSAQYVPALPQAIERCLALSPVAAGLRVTGTKERTSRQHLRSSSSGPKVAIAVHAFYPDVFEEILDLVCALPEQHKLFVTTVKETAAKIERSLAASGRDYLLRVFPNHGRDVLPFLRIFPELRAEGYELLVKLHTKKSLHRQDGDNWRRDMYGKLLDREAFQRIVEMFADDPTLGMVGPDRHYVPMSTYIGSNEERILSIGTSLGLAEEQIRNHGFFAGTMFIARTAALQPLMDLSFKEDDFESEQGQIDGTLAHAIERGMALSVRVAGMRLTSNVDLRSNAAVNDRYGFA